jgi:hypothetical protein
MHSHTAPQPRSSKIVLHFLLPHDVFSGKEVVLYSPLHQRVVVECAKLASQSSTTVFHKTFPLTHLVRVTLRNSTTSAKQHPLMPLLRNPLFRTARHEYHRPSVSSNFAHPFTFSNGRVHTHARSEQIHPRARQPRHIERMALKSQ